MVQAKCGYPRVRNLGRNWVEALIRFRGLVSTSKNLGSGLAVKVTHSKHGSWPYGWLVRSKRERRWVLIVRTSSMA